MADRNPYRRENQRQNCHENFATNGADVIFLLFGDTTLLSPRPGLVFFALFDPRGSRIKINDEITPPHRHDQLLQNGRHFEKSSVFFGRFYRNFQEFGFPGMFTSCFTQEKLPMLITHIISQRDALSSNI